MLMESQVKFLVHKTFLERYSKTVLEHSSEQLKQLEIPPCGRMPPWPRQVAALSYGVE